MSDLETLNQAIASSTHNLQTLQTQKADAAAIAEERKKLGELKKQLAALTGAAGGSKAAAKNSARMLLKTPKVSPSPPHHRPLSPL